MRPCGPQGPGRVPWRSDGHTCHRHAELDSAEFPTDVDERLDDPDNTDPTNADEDVATNISAAPLAFLPAELVDLIRMDLSAESNAIPGVP